MSIGEVSFYTGVLLFLIGVIGGGIDIKEVKIPEIKGAARYMCFIGSVLFLVMGLYLKKEIPPITITNMAAQTVANTPDPAAVNPTQAVVTPTTPAIDSTAPVTEAPRIADSINIPVDANAATKAAQAELDEANKRINVVWNATTKAIRDELLPEQRQWLKKREASCAFEATANEPNVNMEEAFKLHCMATMTDPRTEELSQIIDNMTQ